ncbi:GtrA family protein [bacterium]|nr:GtrA family protein [bacterium]MCI0566393.1 GtrA family protein [bacterium]MCI0680304.1 GtrA family protein [bacterium]
MYALNRFAKYASIGVSTFLFDLLLLFVFIDAFGWHYAIAAGAAFIIAVSCNYYLSRKYVFYGTLRDARSGYIIFVGIAIAGLFVIVGGMTLFIEIFEWHYAPSRIIIAGIVGIWNYLINLYVNFKVAGK